MLTVWKFPIRLDDYVDIEMPEGAEVLCVQMQRDRPQLWARVDTSRPCVKRWFRFAGTGHELAADVGRYIGTVQAQGGSLVFRVFEAN